MRGAAPEADKTKRKAKPKLRIGIQVKSVMVLTAMVLSATAAGGWLYCIVTKEILRHHDHQQACRLADGLAAAAGPELVLNDLSALQRLVNDSLRQPGVHSVAVLDRHGKTVAKAFRACAGFEQAQAVTQTPSLSYESRLGPDFLELGQPVLVPDEDGQLDLLVGGIRLVLDTRDTSKILAGLRREVSVTAALIVLCAIPLGQLLVWRVLGRALRKLVHATRQLGDGDFSARAETSRNDEIGELASSFDTMAERLQASQRQLRMANESLERKVNERTAELERTNRRLRGEMAEKEDFLRAVSHDLNAPLRNIAGMATMITLKHREDLPEDVLARLQRVQANVDAGTDLLEELLELSRIKTRPQKREMVDFAGMLEDIKATFEYDLKDKNIDLTIRLPMPSLYVERNRMRQVFQNLVENAIKYMGRPEGGRIEIGYSQGDGVHDFSVADNGPGIAPAEQERIFFVFRRAPSIANTSVPGKGVGLALVRSIAQNYEGAARVESELGSGSVFHVTLGAECTQPPQENSSDEPTEREFAHAGASDDSGG